MCSGFHVINVSILLSVCEREALPGWKQAEEWTFLRSEDLSVIRFSSDLWPMAGQIRKRGHVETRRA